MKDAMDDAMDDLRTVAVDRNDTQARVDHYDRVARAGCPHDAIVWNGAVVLVNCPRCETSPNPS